MKVPFLDLNRQNREIRDDALAHIARIIDQSSFIGGRYVEEFELQFSRFCETPFGVAVNSGTDALRLAILALGAGPGDEIITVPFTFIATAEVITQCGCHPVFIDVEPDTLNLNPACLEAAITPRTRGVIPVHLYGNPARMDSILAIARQHNLWVLEDACQAHGATWHGRRTGSLGECGAFSFYPTKNMGAFGEGGFVTAADETVAQKITALRNHGQSSRYSHEFEGFNARLDAFQAAILTEKLKRLPRWNEQRAAAASFYSRSLQGLGDLVLPVTTPGCSHAWHLYTVRTSRRDALRQHLTDAGVGTAVHYPLPLHLQKAYLPLGYQAGSLPVSEEASRTVLSLPLFQGITPEEQERVVDVIRSFFN